MMASLERPINNSLCLLSYSFIAFIRCVKKMKAVMQAIHIIII